MSDVTERKMDIILEMKGGIDSMVKQISSAAYEVEQGKFSRVRPVEDTLNTWMTKYSGLLPETIIDSVGSLSSRIRAWKLGNGQTDTVGGMVNGPGACFSALLNELIEYQNQILKESEPAKTVSTESNPWISGSFYLFAALTLMTLFAVISATVPWYALPIVFIAGLLALAIVGALALGPKLSEKGFLKLMAEILKHVPLLQHLPLLQSREAPKNSQDDN